MTPLSDPTRPDLDAIERAAKAWVRLGSMPVSCSDLNALVAYCRALESRVADLSAKYDELIYGVGNKWRGETRHQTALRYIRQAETPAGTEGAAVKAVGGNGA